MAKGAFTGAITSKQGRFELANGGTLFLDEIGEISPALQVKLLRVLQDGKFERLGGTRTIDSDIRIIAATNKDIHREVGEKRFREDLFYRLNVVHIHIPPLRERKEDILVLAVYFLKKYSEKNCKIIEEFTETVMLALNSYDWPGNVRELENAIERAVVFATGPSVPFSVLPQSISAVTQSTHSITFKIGTRLSELERQAINVTLQHTRGDKNMAARLLGIGVRTIYRRLEKQQAPAGPIASVKESCQIVCKSEGLPLDAHNSFCTLCDSRYGPHAKPLAAHGGIDDNDRYAHLHAKLDLQDRLRTRSVVREEYAIDDCRKSLSSNR